MERDSVASDDGKTGSDVRSRDRVRGDRELIESVEPKATVFIVRIAIQLVRGLAPTIG